MDFFFAPLACSMAGHVLIREAGLPINLRRVALAPKQTAEGTDYHEIAPLGQVPVLRFDDGRVLTENSVVLQVLAGLAPERGYLPPRDSAEGLATLEWLSFSATEMHKLCLYPMFQRNAPDAVKAWSRAQLPPRLALAARRLEGRPWLAGEAFTIADAHFGWALALCRMAKVDEARAGALAGYWERLMARPAFAACLEEEKALYGRYA